MLSLILNNVLCALHTNVWSETRGRRCVLLLSMGSDRLRVMKTYDPALKHSRTHCYNLAANEPHRTSVICLTCPA